MLAVEDGGDLFDEAAFLEFADAFVDGVWGTVDHGGQFCHFDTGILLEDVKYLKVDFVEFACNHVLYLKFNLTNFKKLKIKSIAST